MNILSLRGLGWQLKTINTGVKLEVISNRTHEYISPAMDSDISLKKIQLKKNTWQSCQNLNNHLVCNITDVYNSYGKKKNNLASIFRLILSVQLDDVSNFLFHKNIYVFTFSPNCYNYTKIQKRSWMTFIFQLTSSISFFEKTYFKYLKIIH